MAEIIITLTDEQIKAFGKRFNTDDVQNALQDYLTIKANNDIKEAYIREASSQSISALKVIFPDVKVGRIVPEVVEVKDIESGEIIK